MNHPRNVKPTRIETYRSPFKSKRSLWTQIQQRAGLIVLVSIGVIALVAISVSGTRSLKRESLSVPEQVITVIDGDTVDVNGKRIRLHGIDAPERGQSCTRNGASYNCGAASSEYLSYLLTGESLECQTHSHDRWGRDVATCLAGGSDIGRQMVRHGWAVAYAEYSTEYVEDEQFASANGMGMWAKDFELPKDWRKQSRN